MAVGIARPPSCPTTLVSTRNTRLRSSKSLKWDQHADETEALTTMMAAVALRYQASARMVDTIGLYGSGGRGLS